MIFPYDSNSRFSDPKAASPTQRPASRSDARKRAHEAGFSPVESASDPHLDNGFAEVIRKAQEEAYAAGYSARWSDARTGHHTPNPYGEAS